MKLSIGSATVIEFEDAVGAIEAGVKRDLESRCDLIARDGRYSSPRVDSLRHGDAVHTIGLSCHPLDCQSDSDTFALCINLSAIHGLALRGFAFWSQPYVRGRVPGFLMYEAVTPPFRCGESGLIADFLESLQPLYHAFDLGLRRGGPPPADQTAASPKIV